MHNPITAVIIDDESRSIQLLQTLIESYCPDVNVLATAQNIITGQEVIEKVQPDLVFLDISMPNGDGFQLLEALSTINFEVVFTTAYNQYALRAFEFAALHYLLKPINIPHLIETVNRYKQQKNNHLKKHQAAILKQALDGHANKIALAHKYGYDFVDLKDIIRIEGEDGYSHFYMRGRGSFLVSKAIGEYEKLLESNGFFRVHKKHLINMDCIQSFHRGKNSIIVLDNNHEVTLSYRRKEEFINKLRDRVAF